MKKLILIGAAALMSIGAVYLLADDDDRREYKEREHTERAYDKRAYMHGAVKEQKGYLQRVYEKECGSCHMAYQREFLPRRSWEKMMSELQDHFGSDASLGADERDAVLEYLRGAQYRYAHKDINKMRNSAYEDETPLRISELPYFKKEHRKIKKELIEQKEVKSIANCTACHKNADRGDYSERDIDIPNYGRWDD